MENQQYFNFSGGMNSQASAMLLDENECELAVNIELNEIGALTKRPGYVTFDVPAADSEVRSIWSYEGTVYVYLQNGTIYKRGNENSGWELDFDFDSFLPQRVRFANFVDRVFAVHDGATEDMISTDGDGWDSTWSLNRRARYIAVYQARLYAASGIFDRSRVWFSSLPDPSNQSIEWDITPTLEDDNDAGWFEVNPGDGDEITALENNGNRLLIFKNRALYRWNFGQIEPDRLIGVGTSSQESVKTNFDVGATFFANQNGIYTYTGERPRLISRRIQKYVDAVTGWGAVYGEVDNDHYYLFVGDLEVEGRTIPNAMFVYNIALDAWTIYSFNHRVTWMHRMEVQESNRLKVYFGTENGQLYEMNNGTTDAGEPINMEFRSREHMLTFPNSATFDRVDVFARQRGTTQVLMDVDRYNEPATLGQLEQRVTSLRASDIRTGNSIRVYLNDNSPNKALIEGYNIEYTPITRRNENTNRTRKYGNQ